MVSFDINNRVLIPYTDMKSEMFSADIHYVRTKM